MPIAAKRLFIQRFPKMNEELIEWLDLGEISYDDALEIQTRLHGECWRGAGGDKAIFQQNEPLITCGLDSDPAHVLWSEERLRGAGIKIRRVKRGGGVSYHGPGQMVASLVCRFLRYADNAHIFLRRLEEVVLRLLAGYGVAGRRIDGKSGVFVGGDKIAAIGLAVSHSVTMHGMSINIAPEMRHYEAIIACGLAENGITSLERLGVRVDYNSVRDAWLASFEEVFGVRPYAAARGIINKGSANN